MQDLESRLAQTAPSGMTLSVWASIKPDAIAVHDPHGTRTFGALNANANRVVRLLRAHGLKPGDGVALLCSNRAEFVEILQACLRGGFRITPINWHLTADEVAYVVNDCHAKAFFGEARYELSLKASADAPMLNLKVSIDGNAPGYLRYDDELTTLDGADIDDPLVGSQMLYTSGTTGRPKGVFRNTDPVQPFVLGGVRGDYKHAQDTQICPGPAYHGAPLNLDILDPLAQGVPVVFMDPKWDTLTVLQTLQDYRITHGHFVPIMFQRLLAVPADQRAKYDLSNLRYIIHGAAPCPPEVKRAMIDWLGPILHEYYAGSEGGGGFITTSEEWLAKPGTVGKRLIPDSSRVLDEEGNEVPAGTSGMIYFKTPATGGFEYFNDPGKTASNYRDGYFTIGDIGYFDEDDYLFLTGRTAECIISGGVNIYPQEIDNELIHHPAVEDVCTIGAPNSEWGEEVKAVVKLRPGYDPSDALAQDIIEFVRPRLAGFKTPRSLDFVDDLPRSPAGKLQRGKVRAGYWSGRTVQI